MALNEFEQWLLDVGDGKIRGDSLMVVVPGYGSPVTVTADDDVLHALLPGLERDAVEAWGPSKKAPRTLAFQLLSTHIDEVVGSSASLKPTGVILTSNGFEPTFG